MKIFLLRHAQAENSFPDFDRELTKFGYKQVEKLAKHINSDVFENLGEIWSSPYIRAKQTQEHFKALMQLKVPALEKDNILPESDFKAVAKALSQLPRNAKDILIVSHNFFLEELINLLIFGENNQLSLIVKKASLHCLELVCPPSPNREYGMWTINASVYPKFLD